MTFCDPIGNMNFLVRCPGKFLTNFVFAVWSHASEALCPARGEAFAVSKCLAIVVSVGAIKFEMNLVVFATVLFCACLAISVASVRNRLKMPKYFNFGPGAYRFLLATMVLVHHTSSLGLGAGSVYVFFCLSGYWMHTVWVKKYAKASHGYLTFVKARLIRLLPLFWLSSLLGFAVEVEFGKFPLGAWLERMQSLPDLLHFVFSHVFLVGYHLIDHPVIVPAWSLDIEMQFYLTLPILVIVMRRLGWVVLPLSAAMCLWLQSSHAIGTVLNYVFFFYLGMWSSHVEWTPSKRLAIAGFLFTCLVVAVLIIAPVTHSVLVGGAGQGVIYAKWNDLANAFLALLLLPTTIWSAERPSSQNDRMLGDMSYSVYLLHSPLVGIYSLWFGQLPVLQRLPYWVLTVFVVCVVSWLAWRFVDKPVMVWRERYLASRV